MRKSTKCKGGSGEDGRQHRKGEGREVEERLEFAECVVVLGRERFARPVQQRRLLHIGAGVTHGCDCARRCDGQEDETATENNNDGGGGYRIPAVLTPHQPAHRDLISTTSAFRAAPALAFSRYTTPRPS